MAKGSGVMEARLILDGKEFDLKLEQSRRKADKFGKDVNKSTDKAGGGFRNLVDGVKKFAVAIGAIEASRKTFDAWVSNSQANTDAWGRATSRLNAEWEVLKDQVFNGFSPALATGLQDALDRAEALYDAFDKLANVQMSGAFATTLDQVEIKGYMLTGRNKALSMEEREAAVAQARAVGERMRETGEVMSAAALDAVIKALSSKGGIPAEYINSGMIEEAFRVDTSLTSDEERARVQERFNDYTRRLQALKDEYTIGDLARNVKTMQGYDTFDKWHKKDPQGYKAFRDSQKLAYEGEIAGLQLTFRDDIVKYISLFKLSDDELQKLMSTYVSYTQAMNTANEQLMSVNELSATIANEKIANEKKVADAQREAAVAAEEYARAFNTSPQAMAGITYKPAETLPAGIQFLSDEAMRSPFDSALSRDIEEYTSQIEVLDNVVGSLGSTFRDLGGAIGGTADSMLGFVGGLLDATQAIIPFISYLYAEAVAHDTNASAAATEAAAKTLSAYAGIPFAGVALGLSAVTAIIAAIQAVPKFAEGGIVTSATLGVFGEAGPEAVMPLDKLEEYISPRELRVAGNIKASGKELVVVLDNYNRVRNG